MYVCIYIYIYIYIYICIYVQNIGGLARGQLHGALRSFTELRADPTHFLFPRALLGGWESPRSALQKRT